MSKPLETLRDKVKPAVRSAAKAKAVGILAEMSLAELRRERGQNQSTLAGLLNIAQPNVSQIENRPDALISTLRDYIEALGGQLEIRVTFPDGQAIEITQFKNA